MEGASFVGIEVSSVDVACSISRRGLATPLCHRYDSTVTDAASIPAGTPSPRDIDELVVVSPQALFGVSTLVDIRRGIATTSARDSRCRPAGALFIVNRSHAGTILRNRRSHSTLHPFGPIHPP